MAKVYLVGAGPGAADLLTMRAARVIESADVILYDALVSDEILEFAKPTAQLIGVGKRGGGKFFNKTFQQEDINALLVQLALQVELVVRLKGGDPLVFGRAAEEIDALRDAGIDFEIVPGVTAACSAAAAAKISLTDRRVASQVLLTTAHHSEENLGRVSRVDSASDTTIVIYMPGRDYSLVQEQLRGTGIGDETPCLVVSRISSHDQKVFATTVRKLGEAPMLPAPSLVIVGEVARRELSREETSFHEITNPTTPFAIAWYS